jgi:hypothetical protein
MARLPHRRRIVRFVFLREQTVWLAQGLDEAWGLPKAAQGTGAEVAETQAMHFPSAAALAQYGRDVAAATLPAVAAMTEAQLREVVTIRPFGEMTRLASIGTPHRAATSTLAPSRAGATRQAVPRHLAHRGRDLPRPRAARATLDVLLITAPTSGTPYRDEPPPLLATPEPRRNPWMEWGGVFERARGGQAGAARPLRGVVPLVSRHG